jgi:hypothetical protein
MDELTERVALLLYKRGLPGRSPAQYQWTDARDWYLEVAKVVIAEIKGEKS